MDPMMILIAVVGLTFIVAAFIMIMGKTGLSGSKRAGGRDMKLKEADKLLAQNPSSPVGLFMLGEVYFEEEAWDKAMKAYEPLSDMLVKRAVPKIDSFTVHFRFGYSAMKLSMTDQAHRGLSLARELNTGNFEVNHNLGIIEFERKNYEKAIRLFQQALSQNVENPSVLRHMGHALFRMKKPKEAMNFIRRAIDIAPEDKESLYTLAEC